MEERVKQQVRRRDGNSKGVERIRDYAFILGQENKRGDVIANDIAVFPFKIDLIRKEDSQDKISIDVFVDKNNSKSKIIRQIIMERLDK